MPKLNLGRVVGRDGGFGNIDTVYLNDGGAPSVTVEASGEDTAKDFVFTFKNLVRDVATADEVEQIAAGEIVQSSNVITAGVMSSIWAKIKVAFATKSHTHDASDITAGELAAILIANGLIDTDMLAAGAVTTAKIADGSVTKDKLEKTLGDSLSPRNGYSYITNLDIIQRNGLWRVDLSGCDQRPKEAYNWGLLAVVSFGDGGFLQAYVVDTTPIWAYIRIKYNDAQPWRPWVKIETTNNG